MFTFVYLTVSPAKPNLTSKTVLRVNEVLTVLCTADVPIRSARMLLLHRAPGDSIFTEFMNNATNTSTDTNVRECKHMMYKSFNINHEYITNGSEFKCVVQTMLMADSKESEMALVTIKSAGNLYTVEHVLPLYNKHFAIVAT